MSLYDMLPRYANLSSIDPKKTGNPEPKTMVNKGNTAKYPVASSLLQNLFTHGE